MTTPIKLHRLAKSGHSHRVELMLALLGLPYETLEVDMASGAHKSGDFREISPLGVVPVIDDHGYTLADSNAILTYLAKTYAPGSHWLPDEPKVAAEVQRWLTIAAHQIFNGPCAAPGWPGLWPSRTLLAWPKHPFRQRPHHRRNTQTHARPYEAGRLPKAIPKGTHYDQDGHDVSVP